MGHVLPPPLSIVLPIPRYDIAEADEPLIEEFLARGHCVRIITTPDLERRYGFADRGCLVSVATWTESEHFTRRAVAALTDMVRLYRLAADVVASDTCVIAHSNDADFIKPFVETGQHRGATVAFVQMAYFHADVAGHYVGNKARSWTRLSAVRRAFLHARGRLITAITRVRVYVGPRRAWGTNADICFMADEAQARNHIAAGLPAAKFHATGAPFMDMIWRRRLAFDLDARDTARKSMGAGVRRPMLLAVTQNPEWLLPGRAIDRRAFARDLMIAAAEALPEWDIVFKIHPVEVLEDYYAARDESGYPITVIREFNIVTGLLACDLMMSLDVSSPCYYARELQVPQVIFRVEGATINDAHLPNFSGIRLAGNHEELKHALQDLAARPTGPATSAPHSTFDGMASRRIVDALERRAGDAIRRPG